MPTVLRSTIQRREFLKLAGAAAMVGVNGSALATAGKTISVIVDPENSSASSAPVRWAISKLQQAASNKGATLSVVTDPAAAHGSSIIIVVADDQSAMAKPFPITGGPLRTPESVRLAPAKISGIPAILASAPDVRGFVYGVLELAERVQFSTDDSLGLSMTETFVDKTANKVRCMARAFCSEVDDKPWFYDKDFWRAYLDALATSRFNRFAFVFGFGYDFPKGVTGDYFHFPYPYLVDVPGFNVRVDPPLADGERAKNMAMLKFIAAETAARGLQFQLGIWTHAFEWTDSPHSDHHILGLTMETNGAYCRDALAIILSECPEITGITMRVHGESGIPEGSYPFWKTLFSAIPASGRKIEIDMHAKGINDIMMDMAADTGMPVKIGAKSWAEHMGLGYHQADIRELEIPTPERMETGIFAVSNGARRFTRYGYADLYQESRKYDVLYRLWPGTQRHLLWGDPEMAAAYGRTANFCGAAGIEICEPLTFKGREGSGHSGGRLAYVDASMNPKAGDWQKFEYTYRLWGRMLYNPDTRPEVWRRYLKKDFGPASESVEVAVANASRVLALVTTAHLPSASNHSYWPEIYTNMPIVPNSGASPYSDTPAPKVFNTVSPLDPQLFSSIAEHVGSLLKEKTSAKYSPAEVAQWLEDYSTAASQSLGIARKQAGASPGIEFRRMEEDVLIQSGLGRFFSAKLRSGLLYEIYLQTGNEEAGKLALAQYQAAREAWTSMAARAKTVYVADVSYGDIPQRKGHWIDRISGIDKDVSAMQAKLASGPKPTGTSARANDVLKAVTMRPRRSSSACKHIAPTTFRPGQPLALSLQLEGGGDVPTAVQLCYRHVNQGERWRSVAMEHRGAIHSAQIPGEYTNSIYPLQYYFELSKDTSAWFHPAFNKTLSNQPYYAVYERT